MSKSETKVPVGVEEERMIESEYQSFTMIDSDNYAIYEKTAWYDLVFEGDEIDFNMLTHVDECDVNEPETELPDLVLPYAGGYKNHWWTKQTTASQKGVMGHQTKNLLQIKEGEILSGNERAFTMLLLGGKRLALCEKKPSQKWHVRSVGRLKTRMTDAYMDCTSTSGGTEAQTGTTHHLEKCIERLSPIDLLHTICIRNTPTQLNGLTKDWLWVHEAGIEVDFLIEYELV